MIQPKRLTPPCKCLERKDLMSGMKAVTAGLRVITSGSTPPPTPLPQTLTLILPQRRRNVLLLSSVLTLFLPPTGIATAFSIGISGPKDWLRDQKKKASRFLLAPIHASRDTLDAAYLILTKETGSNDPKLDLVELQRLLKSASRDCVTNERDSLVSFQASTGVEVCTFRLLVNNAASLLENKDPTKLQAEAMLADLLRSFTFLGGVANGADLQLPSSRKKVEDALMDTIFSLEKFEQGIKDCLDF